MKKNKHRNDHDNSGVSSKYLEEVAVRDNIRLTWSDKGKPIVEDKQYENNASAVTVMRRIVIIQKRKNLIALRQLQTQQKGMEKWN